MDAILSVRMYPIPTHLTRRMDPPLLGLNNSSEHLVFSLLFQKPLSEEVIA